VLCGYCVENYYHTRRACKPCEPEEGEEVGMPVAVTFAITGSIAFIILSCSVWYIYRGVAAARERAANSSKTTSTGVRSTQPPESKKGAKNAAGGGGVCNLSNLKSVGILLTMLPKQLVAASTDFRIMLAYIQCTTVVLQFQNVVWPKPFIGFLEFLEHLTIDVFSLLPAECMTQNR
jgi:hypothetical protein